MASPESTHRRAGLLRGRTDDPARGPVDPPQSRNSLADAGRLRQGLAGIRVAMAHSGVRRTVACSRPPPLGRLAAGGPDAARLHGAGVRRRHPDAQVRAGHSSGRRPPRRTVRSDAGTAAARVVDRRRRRDRRRFVARVRRARRDHASAATPPSHGGRELARIDTVSVGLARRPGLVAGPTHAWSHPPGRDLLDWRPEA